MDRSGRAGFQRSSRTASRYLSVATKVSVSPAISILIPVSAGSVSSRPAAMATWPIAVASASLPTEPASGGISGSVGYSSSGSRTRVKVALPHLRVARVPSVTRSTGLAGQRPDDLGEQPARHQDRALLVGDHRDGGLG